MTPLRQKTRRIRRVFKRNIKQKSYLQAPQKRWMRLQASSSWASDVA
jgi:ribosomal protein L28